MGAPLLPGGKAPVELGKLAADYYSVTGQASFSVGSTGRRRFCLDFNKSIPISTQCIYLSVFEWDPRKAARNLKDHHVSFEEATTVFADGRALDGADLDHSTTEPRFFLIGRSYVARVLSVTYTVRSPSDGEEAIRLITARRASPKERRAYEKVARD